MTASNTQCNGNATFHDTIMIYQSMSGDAASGTFSFTMTGGSLTSKSGHMFHVTNTHAVITLNGVSLENKGSDVILSVCDDGWNGASNIAELVADAQVMTGRDRLSYQKRSQFARRIPRREANIKGCEKSYRGRACFKCSVPYASSAPG